MNGTKNKFEFSICSIMESPLHCWPLNTMFLPEVDQKDTKVNGKIMKKAKQTFFTLMLLGFMLAVHSEVFARDVQVNVTIRQRAAQPYLYIPATFFWNDSGIKARSEEKIRRLEAKTKARKKLEKEWIRQLNKKKP